VKAKQNDGTAGVDVWDVTDPPTVVGTLKATLNKVPFQDQLYLYPLGAIDNGQYLDLVVVMMGPSDKGIAAILRPLGTPTVVERNPLGVSALHPGIGIYAPPELSTLPSLAFYVSDSDYVYLVRAGFGQLQLVAQSKPPVSATILTRPSDNLNQYDPKTGTSKTAVFYVQKGSNQASYWWICDPETSYTQLVAEESFLGQIPSSPITVFRSGPTYNDACMTIYFSGGSMYNLSFVCINAGKSLGTNLRVPASSVVAPVGYGQYIYFTSADLQSIEILQINLAQNRIVMPGTVVGQPCLGTNGELIVTYDGSRYGNPSGCLALGPDGTIRWTYEPPGCRPATAAVFSLDWVGFFGATADNQPFVDLLINPG
jgi:hypothetical protein